MNHNHIPYRHIIQIMSIVALLMISSINTGHLTIGQGIEKSRAALHESGILHCMDCATLDSHGQSNVIPIAGDSEEYYIGNRNTKVFHRPSCHYLPASQNRIYFETRDEAVNAGYRPCQKCNP